MAKKLKPTEFEKKIHEEFKAETPKEKNAIGRPTRYTKELADLVCERVATHDIGLPRLCKLYPDMPGQETIRRWRYKYPDFRVKYAQAKIDQADLLAEQCLEIADDDLGDIKIDDEGYETFNSEFAARSRIRIDTRKWLASKLMPKLYGDRKELEEEKEKNEELRQQVAELRAKLDAQNTRDY